MYIFKKSKNLFISKKSCFIKPCNQSMKTFENSLSELGSLFISAFKSLFKLQFGLVLFLIFTLLSHKLHTFALLNEYFIEFI